MFKFQKHDIVIHLSYGMGKVISIEEISPIPNMPREWFYILQIEDNGAPKKVFVPVKSASERLRKPISKMEAEKVWNTPL